METFTPIPALVSCADDDTPGRILSGAEYAHRLQSRDDIFQLQVDARLRRIESISLTVAVFVGLWLSTREVVSIVTDYYSELPRTYEAKLIPDVPAPAVQESTPDTKPPIQIRRAPRSNNAPPAASPGHSGGGGDFRARVTQQGLLAVLAGRVKGRAVADADVFAEGGSNDGIDALLSGLGALKQGADGGAGRAKASGIGFGIGYNPGFGGGPSGAGDDIDNLFLADIGHQLELKTTGRLTLRPLEPVVGGAAAGGRSKNDIMRVVHQNLAVLRYAYNRRLREAPGLKGKITVRFAIDEFGRVLLCDVIESSMHDAQFEKVVTDKIRRWRFERVDKPGDVTEVVYPFVFSQ